MDKKTCESKGGTWRNDKCHIPKKHTGKRSRKEIEFLEEQGIDSLLSDVAGVGTKTTKHLAKAGYISCEDLNEDTNLTKVAGVGKQTQATIFNYCEITPKTKTTKKKEKKKKKKEHTVYIYDIKFNLLEMKTLDAKDPKNAIRTVWNDLKRDEKRVPLMDTAFKSVVLENGNTVEYYVTLDNEKISKMTKEKEKKPVTATVTVTTEDERVEKGEGINVYHHEKQFFVEGVTGSIAMYNLKTTEDKYSGKTEEKIIVYGRNKTVSITVENYLKDPEKYHKQIKDAVKTGDTSIDNTLSKEVISELKDDFKKAKERQDEQLQDIKELKESLKEIEKRKLKDKKDLEYFDLREAEIKRLQDMLKDEGSPDVIKVIHEELRVLESISLTDYRLSYEKQTDKEKFMSMVNLNDIDPSLASVYSGVYSSPESVLKSDQKAYVYHMESLYDELSRHTQNEEQKRTLLEELERYRKNYLDKKRELLHKHSSLVSSFIAGPSNFPVQRQKKLSSQYDTKYNKFVEWQDTAQKSIKRKIKAGLTETEIKGALLSDIERDIRQANLKELRGKKAPAWLRDNAKARIEGKVKTLVINGEVERVEAVLKKLEGRGVFTKKHRIWKSIEKARKNAQKVPSQGEELFLTFSYGTVVNNHDVDRLQILFDGKPPVSVRTDLKKSGFRWSPKNMAWQRKNTPNAKYDATYILKKHYEIAGESKEEQISEPKTAGTLLKEIVQKESKAGGILDKTKGKPPTTIEEITDRYGSGQDIFYKVYRVNDIPYIYLPNENKFYERTGAGLTGTQGYTLEQLKKQGVIEVNVFVSKREGNAYIPDRSQHLLSVVLYSKYKGQEYFQEKRKKQRTKKGLSRAELKDFLRSHGFTEDNWGHMKKTGTTGKVMRYKFQKISVRREMKSGTGRWVNTGSNYYSNLKIIDNKLTGLK